MPVHLECQECGKSFKVPPVRKDTAKYCSRECANGHRNDKRKLPRTVIRCKFCGKRFEEHQCHANRRTYCSNECRFLDPDYKEGQRERVSGASNAMWTGGVVKRQDGYLYEKCKGHPLGARDYVLQHRLIMEANLRREYPKSEYLIKIDGELYLSPEYVVHHKNEIRTDNELKNLQVLANSEHTELHNRLRRLAKRKPFRNEKGRNY